MTANQVRALEAQENVRANKERESLTARQNALSAAEMERKRARDTWEQREAAKQTQIAHQRALSEMTLNSAKEIQAEHATMQGWWVPVINQFGGILKGLIGGKN